MIDTEMVAYIQKKVKNDFGQCQWYDGVGTKFESSVIGDLTKNLGLLQNELEEAERLIKKSEQLLSEVEVE